MLTSVARVPTPTPERYAKQLCAHLGRRSQSQYADGEGRIELTRGTVQLHSLPGELTMTASAETPDALAAVCDVTGRHLERFGRRDEILVGWDPPPDIAPASPLADPDPTALDADLPLEEFL